MKKTVVIASPDARQRTLMEQLVDTLPEFRIVARTADLMNTYNEVEERQPQAVLISDVLATLPEFEVMRALFATLDVRWLVMTSAHRSGGVAGGKQVFGGREAGSDLFSIGADASDEAFAQQMYALTRTERRAVPAATPDATPDMAPPPRAAVSTPRPAVADRLAAGPVQPLSARRSPALAAVPAMTRPPPPAPVPPEGEDRVILIGASTGGVDALLTVLSRFPADCPPTLVVQHTGSGFGESLAGLLNRQCLPQVRLATGTESVGRGQVLIGAGTRAHLVLQKGSATRACLLEDGPVSGHVPSVDMLFYSAVPVAARVTAALLTGMGRDGAAGMKALFDAGACTIAQDQASCVVYGMPRAAVDCGAVQRVLPLDRIGDALLAARASDRRHGRELH
ncbi:CheB methylesterase domain-containing protein [Maliponia aquimaris]|uniref:protein-glutamate methylesterase n=1 Tax=Maliponia aquimaris TaxID=1673631 RepID=A0A238KTS3_9RHOB|nr:CheB methylesterase domain-containing protein [Maliponia aquimaris]SMX46205.1 Chemotaxis response regulator protein-glutamate methylesterase [Maliponia aquimaris]